jgi:hypothetical protein
VGALKWELMRPEVGDADYIKFNFWDSRRKERRFRISGAEVGVIDRHPALDPIIHRCEKRRLWPSWFSLRSTRPREMHDRNNLRFIDAHK